VAHRQAALVGPGHVLVHLAFVHLELVLIEGVYGITRQLVGRDVGVDQEGGVGKVVREAFVGLTVFERLWERTVGLALLVHLLYPGAGPIKTVGTGKLTIQVVEGVVLLVEDDQVLDRYVAWPRWPHRRGRTGAQEQ